MTKRHDARIMWRMLGLTKPLAGFMVISVACGVAGFACATFLPVLAAGEAVSLVSGAPLLSVGACVGILCALAIARGVLHYVEQSCNHYIAFKLLAHIRSEVFASLRRLAPAKLAGADRGSLVSMVTADIELLEVFFAHTISPICIAVLMSALMVVLLGTISWQLALVALVGYLVVGVVVPVLVSWLSGDGGRASREQAAGLSTFVLDGLRGLAEVLQFDAGAARLGTLDARSRELVETQCDLRDATTTGSMAAGAAITACSLAELVVGVLLWRGGAVGASAVVVSTVATLSSFGPVVALANLGSTLQGTLASAGRVLDILDEEPVVEEVTEGEDIAFGGATARGVGFSYDDGRVLDDVTLDIPQGSIVGITGRSGSGKSTFCRLLMRFWDVDKGQLAISGQRIDTVRTGNLRDLEALVEQDTYLFHDTIRDNLLIARPDATQGQIEAACRAASVHDFIMGLPQDYGTEVGELGDTLSGGERQRLGLARAFLHDAPFLILDEPTSSLDSLNEGVILRSLDGQRGARTVLLVSHRASTMAVADQTFSMDAGRVS
ncbi:ABC-type multidrug transport system fused ATPase/permease subunit [Olsenella profusa DSM 13989]|uniref:amino acid ABC transporter ATP-binding/permease protein n=1 Tax=Olsenella profusa TaxID=138595 RepID=UPI00277F355B|nr:ABC transporter ATP-binding protein [Olsenella profusa]MDP9860732.1 ABC-type multidrug transport system fused ATPase/permease subunit [Olsenella profusa DSM 13989]